MRRIILTVMAILACAAGICGAEIMWVEKAQLAPDPVDPSVVTFSLDVGDPGSYQVRLMAQGESERDIRLQLALRPEAGGPAQTVHFSFTGQGCG